MKRSIYVIIAVATIFAFGLFFASPNKGLAQIGGFSSPFGGRIIARIPCTCSPGFTLLVVGAPVGGQFILSPTSRIYRNSRAFPPNWVLGLADASAPCLVGNPPGCVPAGQGPIIRIMGTS